jgi:hypothetical protein
MAGLVWFLWERRWRVLGLTLQVFFATVEVEHAKDYYPFPIYPMMFAGGAVALERWLQPWHRLRVALAAVLVLLSLPPDSALHLDAPARARARVPRSSPASSRKRRKPTCSLKVNARAPQARHA